MMNNAKIKLLKKWYTPEIVGLNSKFSKSGTSDGIEGSHGVGVPVNLHLAFSTNIIGGISGGSTIYSS